MPRPLKWYDLITVNSIFTGLTTVSQTLTPLLIPLYVQSLVGENLQGTYFGIIRFATLMVALLTQSIMGAVSDWSSFRLGKRRPFVLIGSIASILFIATIGFTSEFDGLSGYWYLFTMMVVLMFSLNTAQAGAQGLIPDLVPVEDRGKFSGAKALLEIPIPLLIVALVTGNLIAEGRYWSAISVTILVLLISTIFTLFVPEEEPDKTKSNFNWKLPIRLLLMTFAFSIIIAVMGGLVRILKNIAGDMNLIWSVIAMAGAGFLAMILSIGMGVHISIKIGLGGERKNSRTFTFWVINRLAFLAGITNIASFALFYIQSRLGFTGDEAARPASILIALVGVSVLFLSIPSGWLSDRIGALQLVKYSGGVAAVGLFLFLLSVNLPLIYISGIIVGLATGIFYTSNWSLGTQLVPKDASARYLGISNLAGAGAGAVGAFIGGPIADFFTVQTPQYPGIGYIIIFVIYGLLFLFSIWAATRISVPVLNH